MIRYCLLRSSRGAVARRVEHDAGVVHENVEPAELFGEADRRLPIGFACHVMPAGVRSLGAIAPLKARGIDIGRKYLGAGGKQLLCHGKAYPASRARHDRNAALQFDRIHHHLQDRKLRSAIEPIDGVAQIARALPCFAAIRASGLALTCAAVKCDYTSN